MKLGLFFQHQVPKPWSTDTELNVFHDALDQVELADQLGFDNVWVTEHHFTEEYSHSSAPEVFLAAASQRTKRIRLGHGILHMPPRTNPPARVAERLAMLDLVSRGRIEWGSGEGATRTELGGFNIEVAEKKAMWREAVEHVANMMAMSPYPGYQGTHFSMPSRNVVPKPLQKPHPPLWMACTKRESIVSAAEQGMGALVFGFAKPEQAGKYVEDYYNAICSERCVPLGHAVNANIAIVTGLSLHDDEQEAIRRGLDGFKFWGYSLGHYTTYGVHAPGITDLWQQYQDARDEIPDNHGQGGIGTPDQVLRHCMEYRDVGVDQIIFVQQSGKTKKEHIFHSLRLFADNIMPALTAGRDAQRAALDKRLEPFIKAALARKTWMKPLADDDIPRIKALGIIQKETMGALQGNYIDETRGSGVSYMSEDPMLNKKRRATE